MAVQPSGQGPSFNSQHLQFNKTQDAPKTMGGNHKAGQLQQARLATNGLPTSDMQSTPEQRESMKGRNFKVQTSSQKMQSLANDFLRPPQAG